MSFKYPECANRQQVSVRVAIPSIELLFLSKVNMALQNPNFKSSRRPDPSIVDRFVKQIQLMYYQYEVTLPAYVMTPGEKFVLNTIVLVLLSLLTFGTFFYLPRFMSRAASRLVWLYTGPGTGLKLVSMDNTTAVWKELGPVMNY